MQQDQPGSTQAPATSTAAQALMAAGDAESARDVGALDASAQSAKVRLGPRRRGLVERLIYGPRPDAAELQSGALAAQAASNAGAPAVEAAINCMRRGEAFTSDGKLSAALREAVAEKKAYGFTVPAEFGGLGARYVELALCEEELSANGLGALAVEISGELTIGAGSLLAYGTAAQQRAFLPLIAEGELMAFGLTEVRIGVNAKKVRAYVERDHERDCWRLHATGDRNKLWITNATHGGLVAVVARVGKEGKQVGLFILRLPDRDVDPGEGQDFEFSCHGSNAGAFTPNWNSRLHFANFPIPNDGQIQGDGVEVLFYCLRMGRCMLAAMAAGYQRMFAADAVHYARQREGVGGLVIRHELPRLQLGRILGGALQARALSHLSLQQDQDGVDLAGLRDLTKSASAGAALESLIACERVLGGRSFDRASRIDQSRPNVHVFGVVEGEDDLILMGMVKDVTDAFTSRYLAPLLSVIQSVNQGPDGKPLPPAERILRITPVTFMKQPRRAFGATWGLLKQKGFWRLQGWIAGNLLLDLLRQPLRLVPTSWIPRYQVLPQRLRRYARAAERRLRRWRWSWLGINLWLQLELTRAQIPLQRLGKTIEHLVSVVALCHHARHQDASQQRVAALQCELLLQKADAIALLRGLPALGRLRGLVDEVGRDLEQGASSLLEGIEPQPFAHPWQQDAGKPGRGAAAP